MSRPPPNVNEAGDHGISTLREDVLNLLNAEILRISTEQARPGWTLWALLGSLAATLWLLLGVLESNPVRLAIVLPLFLGFSLLLEVFRYLPEFLAKKSFDRGEDRFYGRYPFSETRLNVLLILFRSAILVVIALNYSSGIWWVWRIIVCILYGLTLALSIGSFIMTFQASPERKLPQGLIWQAALAVVIFFGLILAAALGYVSETISSTTAPLVAEYKVAGLLAVGAEILPLLALGVKESSELPRLIDIRRRMLLGYASPERAAYETDEVLLGMTVATVLQHDAGDVEHSIAKTSDELVKISKDLDAQIASIKDIHLVHDRTTRRRVESALKSANKRLAAAFGRGYLKSLRNLENRVARTIFRPEDANDPAVIRINIGLAKARELEDQRRVLQERINQLQRELLGRSEAES